MALMDLLPKAHYDRIMSSLRSIHQKESENNTSRRKAMDTSRASLLGLIPDLLLLILECLPGSDLKSLCLTNSHFTKTAQRILRRNVVLSFPSVDPASDRAQQQISRLDSAGLLDAVRTLRVKGLAGKASANTKRKSITPTYVERFNSLVRWCIAHMSNLRRLEWQGRTIPADVLATLRNRPQVKLSMEVSGIRKPTDLRVLKNTPSLDSIDLACRFTSVYSCLYVTRPLRQILLSCPNIRRLKMSLHHPVNHPRAPILPPTTYHGLGFRRGERPPPLEELELVYYPFGYVSRLLEHGNFEGYPAHIDEGRYWAETFDWSRLRKLKTFMSEFVTSVAPLLVSLEHLSVEETRRGADITPALFCALPVTLRSIEVNRLHYIGVEGLTRHAPTLQELRVHTDGRHNKSRRRRRANPLFDMGNIMNHELLMLRDIGMHISALGLDVTRIDYDWPYITLDVLASFQSVRTLELYFESNVGLTRERARPYLTFSAAAKMFEYLRSRKSNLRTLILHAGNPPEWHTSTEPVSLHFPFKMRTSFECYVAAGEGKAAQNGLVTGCTGLKSKENELLRRILAQYPDGGVKLEDVVSENNEHRKILHSLRVSGRYDACKLAWDGVLS